MARLDPKERKQQILIAAIKLAEREGFNNIRRDGVAAAAGVAAGTVNHYFTTMPQLKRSIMRAAIKHRNLEIISQGLLAKDKTAIKASKELKGLAFAYATI